MKGSDWLIIGGLAIGAYVLYKYLGGSGSEIFGGGGGGSEQVAPIIPIPSLIPPSNFPPNYAPTPIKQIAPNVYTTQQIPAGVIIPSKTAPLVQQTTSIITQGSKTQIGQPAYSGRTTPYIMQTTGTYAQQTQPQRIATILNPTLLKANIGMMVKPMTAKDFPIGTPQNPATPAAIPKNVLVLGNMARRQ